MDTTQVLKTVILPYINFILFFIMLVYFAKKPIIGILKGRRDEFNQSSQAATKKKNDTEAKYKQVKNQADKLEEELLRIKQEALESAELRAAEMIAQAQVIAENIKKEAQKTAAVEVLNAKAQLKSEIIATIKSQTFAKVQNEFDQSKQKSFIEVGAKRIESL
ncbi:MAG: ATP synthase F0 subunit B [Oligoflexales bacterium]|nr:ATP synthase F0 subunit B [Oligoflexales bacterium]